MKTDRQPASLSAAKIALAVKRLRAETEGMHLLAAEPLAIVGMGCRFPGGGDSLESFWQMLEQGVDAVREMPAERWPNGGFAPGAMRRGGYFERVDSFDAEFFGISPREANCIDPQQRMMLEVVWEALADASIGIETLSGSQTGVFVAISNTDYTRLQLRDVAHTGSYTGLGSAACMAAGHLSFLLDTRGPALVTDTSCSSSLTAAHLASQSLRNRECNLALVAGVSLKLLPDEVVVYSQWGMLSADAHCKTFDERADGFVPGEGCGVVVLKRLAVALANGDHIRAVIRGSAVNHDGRTSVMTAPNGLAQEAVMRAALESAAVGAGDVSFIETHGTGTSLGDPIEVEAIRSVYGGSASDELKCLLGAVKTNLGHLESAAGIAGMIKAVLSLEHQMIPRNLHFEKLNPRITMEGSRLGLAIENSQWARTKRARFAAVSSFGLSGTNAHFILEEAPLQPARGVQPAQGEALLVLSARSEAALRQMAERYSKWIARATDTLQDVCANAAVRGLHHDVRMAVAGGSSPVIQRRLDEFAAGHSDSGVWHGAKRSHRNDGLAFVFTGQGTAWLEMGRELLAAQPRARAAVERIDAIFASYAGWSIADALAGSGGSYSLADTDRAQPLIFAVQAALAELLASWGISPDAVTGHSIGELAAAYIAGALTLEEAVRILHLRCECMQRAGKGGRMLAVMLPLKEADAIVAETCGRVVIAAYNSPVSMTLAGEADGLAGIATELHSRDVFSQWVDVEYAFHSPAMKEAADALKVRLGKVASRVTAVPLVSTVTGKQLKDEAAAESHWAAGVSEPVRFREAIDRLIDAGCRTFIEVGPGTMLSRFVAECGEARQIALETLPTLRRSQPFTQTSNHLLAALYTAGRPIEWRGVFGAQVNHVPLPAYPWQRRRFWLEESIGRPRHESTARIAAGHPLLGEQIDSPFAEGMLFESHLSTRSLPYLADHRLDQVPLVPFAAWIELAIAACRAFSNSEQSEQSLTLLDFTLTQPLLLPPEGARVQVLVADQSFRIACKAGHAWSVQASGRYGMSAADAGSLDTEVLRRRCTQAVDLNELYERLESVGLEYGEAFRPIEHAWVGEKEAFARVKLPQSVSAGASEYGMHPALLDGCLQLLGAALGSSADDLFLPLSIDGYQSRGSAVEVWAHVSVREINRERLTADFILAAISGAVVAKIEGLKARRSDARVSSAGLHYEMSWEISETAASVRDGGTYGQRWLVFGGEDYSRRDLVRALEERGCKSHIAASHIELQEALLEENWSGIVVDARSIQGLPMQTAKDGTAGLHPEKQIVLALIEIARHEASRNSPRLRLITSNAVAVEAGDDISPSQTPLIGLARTLALEHPKFSTRIIDIDEADSNVALRPSIIDEIAGSEGSSDSFVAYRGGQRYVAGLKRWQPAMADSQLQWRSAIANGTVLITGGLGALGRKTAQWLAGNGASSLVLMGRGIGSQHDEQVHREIEDLRAQGVRVKVAQADVSDERAMESLLEEIRTTMPPLSAIFHEAGVSGDATLMNLDWDGYRQATAPKIEGGWNLHRLTRADRIEIMVLFSSASSMLGSAGQASYSAGNAFLDGLAHHRSAKGLRTISINWGAWAGDGMVSRLAPQQADRLESQGLRRMQAGSAFSALEPAIESGKAQLGIMDVNWEQFLSGAAPTHRELCRAMQADLRPRPVAKQRRGDLLDVLLSSPTGEHKALLSAHVKKSIRRVLGLSEDFVIEDDRPLQELGLDSLMAVEIRNLLQSSIDRELSSTIVFDHPTVEALVEYLDTLLWVARRSHDERPAIAQQEEISI